MYFKKPRVSNFVGRRKLKLLKHFAAHFATTLDCAAQGTRSTQLNSHCGYTNRRESTLFQYLNINGHADVNADIHRSYLTQNKATPDPPPPPFLGSSFL
jgi:hypothetical protein